VVLLIIDLEIPTGILCHDGTTFTQYKTQVKPSSKKPPTVIHRILIDILGEGGEGW
jgi:hypothetical protein